MDCPPRIYAGHRGSFFLENGAVGKSKSLWAGVIIHVSHNVIAMGMFYDMTVKQGYAGYLVSETGVFLGLIYLLSGVMFWKMQRIPEQT
jgi:hypothetical protein